GRGEAGAGPSRRPDRSVGPSASGERRRLPSPTACPAPASPRPPGRDAMSPLGLIGAASASGIAAAGGPAILGVVVLVEAGVPVPLPGDIVVLVLGARVATGGFPLWAAAVGCELAAVIGTGALLLAAHGPGRVLVRRFGARVGLT